MMIDDAAKVRKKTKNIIFTFSKTMKLFFKHFNLHHFKR